MSEIPEEQGGEAEPFVGFTLGEQAPEDAERRIVAVLEEVALEGWRLSSAEFAVTTTAEATRVVYVNGDESMEVPAPESTLELVRNQRDAAGETEAGRWWRFVVRANDSREFDITRDYGEEPFPQGQLFEPDVYRADLEAYPRESLPVWLAAYVGHGGRQTRTPQQAAAAARADRDAGVWSELAESEFPPFPVMWARWALISAAFVAARSDWGPRITPARGDFESSKRSGSTLWRLPGERAVLSGGAWGAPALDAVYNTGAAMPNFYAGAPEWVTDGVLNARAATGLMSFCYWWDGGRWYRGDSPSARECARAVPGVWATDTVTGIISRLVDSEPGPELRAAATSLVVAAEMGAVTADLVTDVFGDNGAFDVDGALHQLDSAGILAVEPAPMPQELALARVRQFIAGRGFDTTGYPPEQLVAERISCGWMAYVPVPDGEISIGRAIFYIADDGVLEPASSAIAPAKFVAGFERRFQQRRTQ